MVVLTPALVSFAGAVWATMATSRTSAANTVITRFIGRFIERRDIFCSSRKCVCPSHVLRRGGERGESKIQNVFGKNHRREILRREKPEANTVRAKADSVRWARMSGKIPASEYWYAGA